jgi:hypothetical protein
VRGWVDVAVRRELPVDRRAVVLRRLVLRALDVVLRAEVEVRLRAVPAARDVVLRAVPAALDVVLRAVPAAFEVVLRAWLVPLPLLVRVLALVLAVWPVVVLSVVVMLITPLP